MYLGGFIAGCLLIALEEISWGQRLFGYQPPDVFLTDNYQQEFNLHNFADVDLRKAMLMVLLAGFGVAWPISARHPSLRAWLNDKGIVAPGPLMAPGFICAMLLYLYYPWASTGEWVELIASVGFLVAGLHFYPKRSAVTWTIVFSTLLLGMASSGLQPTAHNHHALSPATVETEALARDLREGRLRTRCGVHKRLYTFVTEYGSKALNKGAFATIAGASAQDSDRRAHFLDPWNQPYWVRHICSKDRQTRTVFVYSFGPNRKRDSSPSQILPDDLGAYVPPRNLNIPERP